MQGITVFFFLEEKGLLWFDTATRRINEHFHVGNVHIDQHIEGEAWANQEWELVLIELWVWGDVILASVGLRLSCDQLIFDPFFYEKNIARFECNQEFIATILVKGCCADIRQAERVLTGFRLDESTILVEVDTNNPVWMVRNYGFAHVFAGVFWAVDLVLQEKRHDKVVLLVANGYTLADFLLLH